MVLFKAESPRAGNGTAVGILCSAAIALVGNGVGAETALLWVRGQISPEGRGVCAPRHRGKSRILGQEIGTQESLKQHIPCRPRWVPSVSVSVVHAGSEAIVNVL